MTRHDQPPDKHEGHARALMTAGDPVSINPPKTKPCRACGEQISLSANVCHLCGTPQSGPLWLFHWKDFATAIVAILALLPWLAASYAFLYPLFVRPSPKLVPIVYKCDGSIVGVNIANGGDAIAFIKEISLAKTGRLNFRVMPVSGNSLGAQSIVGIEKIDSVELRAFEVVGTSLTPANLSGSQTLHIGYQDADGRPFASDLRFPCGDTNGGGP